jgi:putative transposase
MALRRTALERSEQRPVAVRRYVLKVMRYTTFRFALDPTPAQEQVLARHAGASRFAYNQCLELVVSAMARTRIDPSLPVPWTRFDLINAFNAWKRSEDAGRVFVVAVDGSITKRVTGLAWRGDVSAQVFEEAAVDFGRALAAYRDARNHTRKGRPIGFPRRKRRGRCRDSFRLRNRARTEGRQLIGVGHGHARTVRLSTIGTIKVHDDTRRLRRMLRPTEHISPETGQRVVAPLARILFATVSRHGNRWFVSLNVCAPDLHMERRHPRSPGNKQAGWVGVDRGLTVFAVAAVVNGDEVGRFHAPKPLTGRLTRLRRASRVLSRTVPGSRNRVKAARRLSREHARIVNQRRSFLHQTSTRLAKTHGKLVIEDLNVAGLMRNVRLSRAIADSAWAEFGRQLRYKTAWLGGELVVCDRWFPSTRRCSRCGTVGRPMPLAQRTFQCGACGLIADRDRNAATNLAAWAQIPGVAAKTPDRQAGGRVTNAPGGKGTGRHHGDGATGPDEGGTDALAHAGAEDTREGWRLSSSSPLLNAL